jgi:ABC-type Fe3+-hydroxamate transport system substrate-binding protein
MTANPVLGGLATDGTATDLDLVAELVALEEQAEPILARIAGIKAELAERHPAKGDYPAGDYTIKVTVSQRLDTKKIEADFPVAQNHEMYKQAVDTTYAKAVLQKRGLLEQYQVASAPSVKVA